MCIDDAGRDDVPVRIDGLARVLAQLADRGDLSVGDTHVGTKARHPRTINDCPVANKYVVHGSSMPSARRGEACGVAWALRLTDRYVDSLLSFIPRMRLADKCASVSPL